MGYTAHPARGTRNQGRLRSFLPAAACAVTLSIVTPATSVAQESSVTALVSEIASREADINNINLAIGELAEGVNQALVDLHDAQSLAEQARRGATEGRDRLNTSQADVERAQQELDDISRSNYRAAGTVSPAKLGDADQRKDALDRQTYLRKEAETKQSALEDLERSRTIAANEESTLRQVSRLADERERAALDAESAARNVLEESLVALDAQVAQRDAAVSELAQAQAQLEEARPSANSVPAPAQPTTESESQSESESNAADSTESANAATAADELPASQSESAEDAEDAENTEGTEDTVVEAAEETAPESEPESAAEAEGEDAAEETSTSEEASFDPELVTSFVDAFAEAVGATQPEHGSLADPYEDEGATVASPSNADDATAAVEQTDEEAGTNVAEVLPEVKDQEAATEEIRQGVATGDDARQQQIEAVIARAESQIGTPYVWGGGDASGPTSGIPDGRNAHTGQNGFDCSGLVLYAYSGAGVSLPHYTGYQYQRGTQIPVAQAERGDLLFWGAGGSQHVAIYLGDGMMLEAPQSGMNVQKTPVRQSGLAPYAVRLI